MINEETTVVSKVTNRERVEISALLVPSTDVMQQLSGIYVECFNGFPWFENWDAEMAETTLRTYMANDFTLLVARNRGEVVGFSVAAPLSRCQDRERFAELIDINTATYLSDVAVAPSAQGCGIGTALVSAFIELSASRGATNATLRTRENNLSAIKIFERLGFEECLRYQAETGGVESTRLGYVLRLAQPN